MKFERAKHIVTLQIEGMTLEQVQKNRVNLIDALRESQAEYGSIRAVLNGFYIPVVDSYATGYTPKDPWLSWNLKKRLDEAIAYEQMLLEA